MNQPLGKIFLVGAGPGDPELLTLKAARVLRECEVVLYDRLVNPEVLGYANPVAERVYVGKHQGEQNQVQTKIFDLLLNRARAGKRVVRLKGGDPLVFGRGAEEWALAVDHDIEVEIVPGISASIAVPGLAGIPLTYRRISQSFLVVTGHCGEASPEVWSRYGSIDTLVVLMGVKNRQKIAQALISAGRKSNEPVAFIERGATAHERVIVSTLGKVALGEVTVESPAVFVIGRIVQLRHKLRPED